MYELAFDPDWVTVLTALIIVLVTKVFIFVYYSNRYVSYHRRLFLKYIAWIAPLCESCL